MTRRARVAAVVAVLILSAAVVGAAVLPGIRVLRPPKRVCVGEGFEVGGKDGPGVGDRFQVLVARSLDTN